MEMNKNMTSAMRVTQLLDENGWNQSELARLLGVSPQSVQFWVSGKTAPRGKNLSALSRISGYPEHWFLMDSSETISSAAKLVPETLVKDGAYRVELLDIQASAGPGIVNQNEFVETIKSIEYTNQEARSLFGGRPSEHVKIITVKGDSMRGTIEPGDEIFIDININHFDGDGIYVFAYGQTLHVKRLQMMKNELLVLSDNDKYRDWSVDEADQDQFSIAGKVLLSQSRSYKRHG